MNRREFLQVAGIAITAVPSMYGGVGSKARAKADFALQTFDYSGAQLLPGMFAQQVQRTRDLYFGLSNDDILNGFRREAGLRAPGQGLSGWCSRDSAVVFGQWISGMARLSAALHDEGLRRKAVALIQGWTKTLGPDGNPRMDPYGYDKIVCGLVDLATYGRYSDAWDTLERITQWASKNFDRSRSPATPLDRDGRKPHGTNEWYTLSENLYRAYLLNGNELYKQFGDVWLYPSYWNLFLDSTSPAAAAYLHSYSHCNTFSSAAVAFAVTGDGQYLKIIQNGYEYMTRTQCYASGGYGPGEWSVPADGSLGRALEFRSDTAEIPCGSWGGFKLSKYLLQLTGEARYGDWIERLLYNGIGAAPLPQPSGQSFYYADYRLGMASKEPYWDHWPCCSGTYIQCVADYHDLIYLRDSHGLLVNLYVPSEVTWNFQGQSVSVRQESAFPASESINFRIQTSQPLPFALRFRVPGWSNGLSISVNGQGSDIKAQPGEWATVERTWQTRDQVTVTIPLNLRLEAVDPQHPHRAAVMFGPVLLAQDARYTMPLVLQNEADLSRSLLREGPDIAFKAAEDSGQEQKTGPFSPFYSFGENRPYRVYFDWDRLRFL